MKTKSTIFIIIALLTSFSQEDLWAQSSQEMIYRGEITCRECHQSQFNKWRLTGHAKAYTAMFKPEAKQIAELSGIDIKPHESPICFGCHTTAYYVEDWQRDDTFHFEDGIQCEHCHSMPPTHMMKPDKNEIVGYAVMPQEHDCMVCHKEKNSHIAVLDVEPFNYEDALKQIDHSGMDNALNVDKDQQSASIQDAKFVGALDFSKSIKSEHAAKIYSTWRASKHAQAYAILDSDGSMQIAKEMGVSAPPQRSEVCLQCHATTTEPQTDKRFDVAQGVQCESCHGPGRESLLYDHVKAVDKSNCVQCHSAGIHDHPFDFDTYWSQIDHSNWEKEVDRLEYKTPFNVAVTQDGKRLFVACEASNSLIVVSTKEHTILAETEIGMQPHFVCFSPDEKYAYVSNRASDNVSVIETKSYDVVSTIAVGDEPHEIAITEDDHTMYVANAGTYDVSVVDLRSGREIKRLAASRGPWGAALSPDGRFVYISNNLPRFGEFRETSISELTVINTSDATVHSRHSFKDANLLQGIAVSPDNEFVIVTLIRTKNLVPMTRNIQGWIITNGIGILWKDGRVDQLLLDEINDFFADPTDVVFSKDGKYAFVSGGGVQEIAMIDIQKMKALLKKVSDEDRKNILPNHLAASVEYVVKRIQVGQSPRGMAISPDNKYLFVTDALDDAISVIDIRKQKRVDVIDLGSPKEIDQARYGERIFHSAEFTYARQFSCHSCHPDGGIDGITYDIEPDGLGFNPVDNRTLRGINDTAPFKWTGKNPTLKRQCGPRLAAFFTRIDPFKPEQSEALDRYIVTIPRPPNRHSARKELTPSQRRGKLIFERIFDNSGNPIPLRNHCHFCHPPPYYTNREKFDVGSSSWLDTHGVFDVPHLKNIYATSPYLHDGRAQSLDEIWTIYNPKDTHGQTNDLTKDQLNDLVEYLKSL